MAARAIALAMVLGLAAVLAPQPCPGAGVTIITHGLNGNVDGWITGMADQIPNYYRFPGTNFTCYELSFYYSGGYYYLTNSRVCGSQPLAPESGEIIVKLDWRDLADGYSYDTYQVAAAVVPALLSRNFIPELGGHALAELPLHLVGHSRGGSLVCEMSRLLGTNGVWVDQITTLDPHPLNNDGFVDFVYSAVDAPARTYSNVLFHDNYWQDEAIFIYGEPVAGAYRRHLVDLCGGYGGCSGAPGAYHSNVHLWYHGTIDFRNPASDTEATIADSERQTWWTAYEDYGLVAGFNYSLIGGGDRASADQPAGAGFPAIRDGFNQWWDLGAGTSDNRTALSTNNGNWPNLIRINRTATNQIVQGQSTPVKFYYQWARPNTSIATVAIYLDDDLNPLNTNQILLKQVAVPGNGDSVVSSLTTDLALYASNAAPGYHALLAKIDGGGQTRYLYAPEFVEVLSLQQPPTLDLARSGTNQFRIGVNGLPGQTVTLTYSTNLASWLPLVTNTLATNRWVYTDAPPVAVLRQFYRATLSR